MTRYIFEKFKITSLTPIFSVWICIYFFLQYIYSCSSSAVLIQSFFIFTFYRSPSERSGKGCCGQWFAGPPLRAVIAVVALGGVACALGGAALGATGLAGPPSSHLTAALLMIGMRCIKLNRIMSKEEPNRKK